MRWISETIRREQDPESGSNVVQITSSCVISHDIYGEQPYASSDGKRIVVLRSSSTDYFSFDHEVWVADLEAQAMIKAVTGITENGCACSAWGDYFYYLCEEGKSLRRLCLKTLENEEMFRFTDCPTPFSVGTVSPDHRYYACGVCPPFWGILRIDLATKEWKIIHQHPEILNSHVMFDLAAGKDLLIQHNRGSKTDENGQVLCWLGPEGCTLYLIDKNGENRRPLPVGPPYTAGCTGHECFIGKTGRVLFSIVWKKEMPGSLYSVGPGDKEAKLVARNKTYWGHVSASKCGRYFIADGHGQPGTPIYVGNIATGRFRRLINAGCSCGRPEYTHADPYMTADNQWLIFNSDRTGIPQVYAARVPEEFLKSLE